ncbi:hypothetical protein COOONC_05943 [Cooperia oncophora]
MLITGTDLPARVRPLRDRRGKQSVHLRLSITEGVGGLDEQPRDGRATFDKQEMLELIKSPKRSEPRGNGVDIWKRSTSSPTKLEGDHDKGRPSTITVLCCEGLVPMGFRSSENLEHSVMSITLLCCEGLVPIDLQSWNSRNAAVDVCNASLPNSGPIWRLLYKGKITLLCCEGLVPIDRHKTIPLRLNGTRSQSREKSSARNSLPWTVHEQDKLVSLVERHRMATGRVQWVELEKSWEALRKHDDPVRTRGALKAPRYKSDSSKQSRRALNGIPRD